MINIKQKISIKRFVGQYDKTILKLKLAHLKFTSKIFILRLDIDNIIVHNS